MWLVKHIFKLLLEIIFNLIKSKFLSINFSYNYLRKILVFNY